MPDPVAVLAGMRRAVAPGGTVLIMDEKVAEAFAPDGDEVERLFYGFSLMCCLPDGLSTPGSVGTGTVMRRSTLEEYARAAGFTAVEVLDDLDNDIFRFYRLVFFFFFLKKKKKKKKKKNPEPPRPGPGCRRPHTRRRPGG